MGRKVSLVQLICKKCGVHFERRPSEVKTYCSKKCSSSCPDMIKLRNKNAKKTFLEKYGGHPMTQEETRNKQQNSILKNHGVTHALKSKSLVNKVKNTKLERYGDENYCNKDKIKETKIKKYGIDYCKDSSKKGAETSRQKYGIHHLQLERIKVLRNNAKKERVSNFQYNVFKKIQNEYKDSFNEHYLQDIGLCVDIFIPSLNTVVECYGDYWHCNPKKYNEDFFNYDMNMLASTKWKNDKNREKTIKNNYNLIIIWESDFKKNNFNLNDFINQENKIT